MSPGGQIPIIDWLINVEWSSNERTAVIAAENSVISLRSKSFRHYAEELARLLRSEYGIAYEMEKMHGPATYVFGITQEHGTVSTGEAYEEERNVARWGNIGMAQSVWRAGVIRDVYPWNLLTAPQLGATVDGVSLWEWIEQDLYRGSLNDVSEIVTLWDVPDASIPTIRSRLREAHVIFDWRRFQ
jgi:hypothetical protein